jgi:hypothetical protein
MPRNITISATASGAEQVALRGAVHAYNRTAGSAVDPPLDHTRTRLQKEL